MNLKEVDRMRNEWWQLTPRMRLIVCDADNWVIENMHQSPVWTCFMRTTEEQQALFEAHEAQSPMSVHCVGRGADMRLLIDDDWNAKLRDYITDKYGPYDPSRPDLPVCLIHGGTAKHLHFQSIT